MTHPRILCLGEILYDFLANQPGRSLDQVESWTPYPGGAPANVACALTKLGTPAGFIGCVGQDKLGTSLVQVLQDAGVNLTGIQLHLDAPTRSVYVLRSESGDRSFAGFGDYPTTAFADTHLQANQLPEALFESAEYLVLGTLELAYPNSRAAIQRALELADQYYVKVLVDVNWRPVFWPDPEQAPPLIHDMIAHADFLKLSDEEAEWLFHTTEPGAISDQVGSLEGVVVTAGEKGCAYHLAGNEGHLPAFHVPVQDTTGAGDAFVAGLLHQLCLHGLQGLLYSETVQSMVRYACAVGALTTTRPGAIAAQPTAIEVDTFLATQKG
jgi:fructokinase